MPKLDFIRNCEVLEWDGNSLCGKARVRVSGRRPCHAACRRRLDTLNKTLCAWTFVARPATVDAVALGDAANRSELDDVEVGFASVWRARRMRRKSSCAAAIRRANSISSERPASSRIARHAFDLCVRAGSLCTTVTRPGRRAFKLAATFFARLAARTRALGRIRPIGDALAVAGHASPFSPPLAAAAAALAAASTNAA